MAKALAASKGRPAAGRRPPSSAGADSPTQRSPPPGPAQRQVAPAQQPRFDAAFALSGDPPSRPNTGAAAPAPQMDDLLGFGAAPAPPAPQAAARGKTEPAALHSSDLLAFVDGAGAPPAPQAAVRGRTEPAAHGDDLLAFVDGGGAPPPPVPVGAARLRAVGAAGRPAGLRRGGARLPAARAGGRGAGWRVLGRRLRRLRFGEDFADFARAPPPKAAGPQGLGGAGAAAQLATGNLLDF
ncbi:unnamed protein product [Prorocentrum cordatum]|uniref:Uncharacterized protein n=1 Tax=Prorocentrum cordatum TaxID=2364126 RepID=A0ABN9X4C7_9DINO|nr:unnamed protein product [Polarella glacialis]